MGREGCSKNGNHGLVNLLPQKDAIAHLSHKVPLRLGISVYGAWLGHLRGSLTDPAT